RRSRGDHARRARGVRRARRAARAGDEPRRADALRAERGGAGPALARARDHRRAPGPRTRRALRLPGPRAAPTVGRRAPWRTPPRPPPCPRLEGTPPPAPVDVP